jgi:molybdopterin/thiamine biosynthesis adenylyltransferase
MTATLDDFYREFTERNRGFISERAQSALRNARVLIAGCGSTGGAAVEPLARIGVQDFVLVDVGEFELNNLNRQHAAFGDIGRHKAEVAEERVMVINPNARTKVITGGITHVNAQDLAQSCTLVIDGVDVTEHAGWRAKYNLHEAAVRAKRPVLSGYDMAGTQYIRFYDYRRPGSRPFDGKITAGMVEKSAVWPLLLKAIPLRFVPLEMIRNAREHIGEEEYSVPQLVYASLLFGALATRMTVEILAGQPVRRHVVVDAHREARRTTRRWATGVQRPLTLAGGLRELVTIMRNRESHTKKQGEHS